MSGGEESGGEQKPVQCQFCFFFAPRTPAHDTPTTGHCVIRSAVTFPIRGNTEWCGEFRPREETIYPLWPKKTTV